MNEQKQLIPNGNRNNKLLTKQVWNSLYFFVINKLKQTCSVNNLIFLSITNEYRLFKYSPVGIGMKKTVL